MIASESSPLYQATKSLIESLIEGKNDIVHQIDSLVLCDSEMNYLKDILMNLDIPFENREAYARRVLVNLNDFTPEQQYKKMLLCAFTIAIFLSKQSVLGFFIFMEIIKELIKEEKLKPSILKLILRKLEKNKLLLSIICLKICHK